MCQESSDLTTLKIINFFETKDCGFLIIIKLVDWVAKYNL